MPGGDETFEDVLRANAAYARAFTLAGLEPRAARGLGVLTCIDSRIEPLTMLGLRPGDAKILRNAGARVTEDVVRSLVASVHLLGVDRIMVVAHTKCRMTSDPEEARRALAEVAGDEAAAIDLMATPDQRATLREDVGALRSTRALAGVAVGGFVYDVDTGVLVQVC